jgi:hypothetical protein
VFLRIVGVADEDTYWVFFQASMVSLMHVENAALPVSLESMKTERKEGAAAMKQHAIHFVGLDVHQSPVVASVRDESAKVVKRATEPAEKAIVALWRNCWPSCGRRSAYARSRFSAPVAQNLPTWLPARRGDDCCLCFRPQLKQHVQLRQQRGRSNPGSFSSFSRHVDGRRGYSLANLHLRP